MTAMLYVIVGADAIVACELLRYKLQSYRRQGMEQPVCVRHGQLAVLESLATAARLAIISFLHWI